MQMARIVTALFGSPITVTRTGLSCSWTVSGVLLAAVWWAPLATSDAAPRSGKNSANQVAARLDKARDDYQKKSDLYRRKIEAGLSAVEADVIQLGSPDVLRCYQKERARFEAGGPPPTLLRAQKYQKLSKDAQDKLLKAQREFESALRDALTAARKGGDESTVSACADELQTQRGNWVVPVDSRQDEFALLTTAERPTPSIWLYTTSDPGLSWTDPDFSPSGWQEGRPGFGSSGTPNIKIVTTWTQERIWLRNRFDMPGSSPDDILLLSLRYDEDAEIFVNGKLLLKARGFNNWYELFFLTAAQKALFHEGPNVIAVFCRNSTGGQAIDVGLTLVRGGSDVVAREIKAPRDPDLFEVGALWEGTRTHLDPVTPGETLNLELEILQRMGPRFAARLHVKGPKGASHRFVTGTLGGKKGAETLELIEPTAPPRQLKYDGKLANSTWKYEFRGNGGQGAERYGHGELKSRSP